MRHSDFELSNKELKPSGAIYSENVESVKPLFIWTDEEQCVSLWRPSLLERLSILFYGNVWLAVLSGATQPPVAVAGQREYLKQDDRS